MDKEAKGNINMHDTDDLDDIRRKDSLPFEMICQQLQETNPHRFVRERIWQVHLMATDSFDSPETSLR